MITPPGAELRPVGQLAPGKVLYQGRFRIDLVLAIAPAHALYRAWDLIQQRAVTLIECSSPGYTQATKALERAAPLLEYEHPIISPIQVIFVEHATLFFVLAIGGGQTITQIMDGRSAPIVPAAAIRWIVQAADGVLFLTSHLPEWVMGDLSASSMLVTAEDRVVLLGFGIALGLVHPAAVAGALPQGAVAPELLHGYPTSLSDVYSLAATLHLLLTRRYWRPDDLTITESLAELRPDLPRSLVQAIMCGLADEPAERWPDVSAFREAIVNSLPGERAMSGAWASSLPIEPIDEESPTLVATREHLRAALAAEAVYHATQAGLAPGDVILDDELTSTAPRPVVHVPTDGDDVNAPPTSPREESATAEPGPPAQPESAPTPLAAIAPYLAPMEIEPSASQPGQAPGEEWSLSFSDVEPLLAAPEPEPTPSAIPLPPPIFDEPPHALSWGAFAPPAPPEIGAPPPVVEAPATTVSPPAEDRQAIPWWEVGAAAAGTAAIGFRTVHHGEPVAEDPPPASPPMPPTQAPEERAPAPHPAEIAPEQVNVGGTLADLFAEPGPANPLPPDPTTWEPQAPKSVADATTGDTRASDAWDERPYDLPVYPLLVPTPAEPASALPPLPAEPPATIDRPTPPAAPPQPIVAHISDGPIKSTRTPSRPLGVIVSRLRDMLHAPSQAPAKATGTIVLPRQMFPRHVYSILVRIQRWAQNEQARLTGDALAIVEIECATDAFYLPVKKLALQLPAEGTLSEGTLTITALRPSSHGSPDRLIFTFRTGYGKMLHEDPFVADVTILSTDHPTSGQPMLTLVHLLDLS